MANIRYKVTVKGLRPVMINAFNTEEESGDGGLKRGKKNYGTPREQALKGLYVDEKDGKLYVPTAWFQGTMCNSGKDFKQAGKRSSFKDVIGSAIIMLDDKAKFLEDYTPADIQIDSRGVVVPATKGRILRHRAILEKWSVSFEMLVEDNMISKKALLDILNNAGRVVGVGDGRKIGFGRFTVTGLDALETIEDLDSFDFGNSSGDEVIDGGAS